MVMLLNGCNCCNYNWKPENHRYLRALTKARIIFGALYEFNAKHEPQSWVSLQSSPEIPRNSIYFIIICGQNKKVSINMYYLPALCSTQVDWSAGSFWQLPDFLIRKLNFEKENHLAFIIFHHFSLFY